MLFPLELLFRVTVVTDEEELPPCPLCEDEDPSFPLVSKEDDESFELLSLTSPQEISIGLMILPIKRIF